MVDGFVVDSEQEISGGRLLNLASAGEIRFSPNLINPILLDNRKVSARRVALELKVVN